MPPCRSRVTRRGPCQARLNFADEGLSFVEYLHRRARREYPTDELDSIDPSEFDLILKSIQGPDQFWAVLQTLPDEAAPTIDHFLRYLHRDYLPTLRDKMRETAERLPRPPAGGRPRVTPSSDDRAKIAQELNVLIAKDVPRGDAQRQIAKRYSKSLREVQRIWKEFQDAQ